MASFVAPTLPRAVARSFVPGELEFLEGSHLTSTDAALLLPRPIDVLPLVWYDGDIVPVEQVDISPLTHALHFGTSVFDGVRGYRRDDRVVLFRLHDHVRRLHASAEAYGLAPAFGADAFAAGIVELVRRLDPPDCYVRPLCWFGHGTLSLAPYATAPTRLAAFVVPLGDYFGATGRGLRLTISPWRKTPSASLPSWVKCSGHYTNSVLATSAAARRGFDEALLLNERGEIAEGSCENVFLVIDGTLVTNDVDADILPGVTRASVLELARRLEIPAEVRPLRVADLDRADEVFLTGTAAEIAPVDAIDERNYASGAPESVTGRIRAAYTEVSRGRAFAELGWCTHVEC